MISKDLIPFTSPFTEAETDQFFLNLWHLLAKQAERYTMGDSTSVPVETAQELLASICFTLQFEMEVSGLSSRDLLGMNLYVVLKNGQAHLERKSKEVKALWEHIYALAESLDNSNLIESLALIGQFFKKYDYHFFAHQTPWDMGILLFGPDIEDRKGITYVEAYLNGLQKLVSSAF